MSDILLGENLINGFIEREFELFVDEFDTHPVPRVQDTRAMAIEWVSFYFTEYVSDENKTQILGFLQKVMAEERYSTFGWYRVPAILGAAFVLTTDRFYLTHLLGNLDHHSSMLRRGCLEAAAMICPAIGFDYPKLTETTEKNIEVHHFFWEEHVLLSLSARGETAEKKVWLDKLRSRFPEEIKLFDDHCGDPKTFFRDSYFPDVFNEMKTYLICKMLANPTLPTDPATQQRLVDHNAEFESIWRRADSHPLGSALFNVKEFYENGV